MNELKTFLEEETEEFVKELSYKVKYFCCGQYEEHSVEMDAFQSGVSTAIGMMSIDLLGGVKSKGMLELYTERLLKEERESTLEEERRFILNVLDGIDIADKAAGIIGGTQAIRMALESRWNGYINHNRITKEMTRSKSSDLS